MGGGVAILDASIERVQRDGPIWRVFTSGPMLGPMQFEVDDVIVATGFTSPLGDLPALGVATFNHGRLPRLTHYWESATMPGIYFAGTITQAAPGLRKHGAAGNSAAVGGFRHNARVLAHYLAREHFGVHPPAVTLRREDLVPYLLSEVTRAGAVERGLSGARRPRGSEADLRRRYPPLAALDTPARTRLRLGRSRRER
jgi:hypothetical protein